MCCQNGPVLYSSGRHAWLDLARGLAVVSMVIAHTAPAGGVWNVSEYLTAPLFALCIGAAMGYAADGGRWSVPRQLLRGVMLIVIGLAVQPIYWGVLVVLMALGTLMLILAPAARWLAVDWRRSLAVAVVLLIAVPAMMTPARAWLATRPPDGLSAIVRVLVADANYRALGLAAASCVGFALVHLMGHDRVRWAGLRPVWWTLALGAAAGLAVLIGKRTSLGGDPYAGSWPELAATLAIAAAAAIGSRWLVAVLGDRDWPIAALLATGRLALSAYIAQLVILRLLAEFVLDGGRDDHWWVLVTTTVLLTGLSWGWSRTGLVGPAEFILRLPERLLPGGHAVAPRI